MTKDILNKLSLGDLWFKAWAPRFPITDTVNSQINLYKAYGHVKTILFFIGYSRSRHTLLGSLLDAHPHMVIGDETMALFKWNSKRDVWMNSSIYTYFDIMTRSSQRAVSQGRRSELFDGTVANATSNFRYYVPKQWQGTFDQYIEVRRMWGIGFALKSNDPICISCIFAICVPMICEFEELLIFLFAKSHLLKFA